MAVVECGIRENLAEYYGQKSAPTRLEDVGREAGQTPIFFTQARNRELNEGLDSQHDSGVDPMKRISNTKASRTAAEREEYDRINAHLDQALELTFPCSDRLPSQLTAMTYSDAKRPSISQESVSPSPDPKVCEGEPDNANLSSSSPVIGDRDGQHISGYA